MVRVFSFLIFCYFVTAIQGCNQILLKLGGYKNLRTVSWEENIKLNETYDLVNENSYILDTSYLTFLKLHQKEDSLAVHSHYQPLQYLVFDSTGKLIRFLINCNVRGFRKLKWNPNGEFEVFPPLNQEPVDSIAKVKEYLSYLRGSQNITPDYVPNAPYYVLVLWTEFMGVKVKPFLKLAKQNSEIGIKMGARVYFVNIDSFYYYLFEEEEKREKSEHK